jgi:hypothetical protein
LPSVLQPEEVVEVFTGDTLEEAMAFAVAALGPDLSVRRARKVRRGVQGLVGKDRYEVVAIPAPSVSSEGAVESAFDALLFQAEEAEEPSGRLRRTTRPALAPPAVPHPAPAVAQHVVRQREPSRPEPVELLALPAPVEPVFLEAEVDLPPIVVPQAVALPALPVTEVVAEVTTAPIAELTDAPAPTAKPAPAARKRAPRTPKPVPAASPPGWSLQALADLGLPPSVLAALPSDEPADDLAWVVALAVAMTAVLPAPAALDAAHPLVVNGYGIAGVIGLLDAAARGLTPGTITVGDRTAAATAAELALVVRTAVVG